MRFVSSISLLVVAALEATCTPVALAERASPTLYLAGDSTMAKNGANDGSTDGEFLVHTTHVGGRMGGGRRRRKRG